MGLLTNPNSSSGGMVAHLGKHAVKYSWILFVAGVGGFFLFAWTEFSHKTYFSENALLPGLVRGEFNEDRAAER